MAISEERLREIRERAEAATPGPWITQRFTRVWSQASEEWVVAPYDGTQTQDADFIAHARQDIPDLLAALEEANVIVHWAEGSTGIKSGTVTGGTLVGDWGYGLYVSAITSLHLSIHPCDECKAGGR